MNEKLRIFRYDLTVSIGMILIAIPLAFQMFVSQLPLEHLLAYAVNDDSFYYLEVAHRAAAGQGFTFDGINNTNGFQPAWQFILVGIASLVPTKMDLLRLALIVCAVFNAVTGIFIWASSRMILSRGYSLIPLVVWMSLQFSPSISQNLMESNFNWLVFSITLWYLLRITQARHAYSPTAGTVHSVAILIMGFLCGLLFLARVDNLVYIACVSLLMSDLTHTQSSLKNITRQIMERAKIVLAIAVVAGLLAIPYLMWNLLEFGNLMPISGIVKQKVQFLSVIEPRGGYLSTAMWIYAIRIALEKLLWSLAFSLKTFGLGLPFWMTNLASLILISISLCLAYIVGLGLRMQLSKNTGQVYGLAPIPLFKNLIIILIPFWFVYNTFGAIFIEPVKQLTKFTLIVLGLGVAIWRGINGLRNGEEQTNFDIYLARVIIFFSGGMILHALIVAYMLGYGLDYTNWYFANWFVIISLLVGLVLAYLDTGLKSIAQNGFRYFLVAWLFIGILITLWRSINHVTTHPVEPPILTNALYRVARWIDDNLPGNAILASYDAGVIGYFSNRATINLDGLVNNSQLLPYLWGPKTMTEYISLMCPDYLVTFVDGKYTEGELPSGNKIRGIDKALLIPIKWMSNQSWLGQDQTQIVFKVLRTDSCLQSKPSVLR